MKKIIALLLCLCMLLVVFAGCSGDAKPAKDNGNKGGKTEGGLTDVTFFFGDDNVKFPQNMERPNMITVNKIANEQFGININIETCLSTEIESVLNSRFASGENLPDCITYAYTIQRAAELYDQGMILGLSDLIKENAPDIQYRMVEATPAIAVANSNSEGEILRITSVEESIQHEIYVAHIRYDWLDALKLDVPTTPDEFLETLVAFREQDANGNGREDEIFSPGSLETMNSSFCTAFDIPKMAKPLNSWAVDDNGKVYNTFTCDKAKDYLAWCAKLSEAGVLDKEFTNTTADAINQKRYNNLVAGITGAWWDSVVLDTQIAEKVPGANYVPMDPLISASGDQFIIRRNNTGWNGFMLSRDCADPVGVIKLLNWGYTKEGTQILYFGEAAPGGDYYVTPTDVPEGITDIDYQLVYTDKGTAAMNEEPELWAKMGWNQTSFMPQYFLSSVDCIALEFYTSFGVDACGTAAEVEFNQTHLNNFIDKLGRREISFATPTPEQIEELNKYDDLWTYMEEDFINFILGNKSLDEWDEYVATCNEMGLQDATSKVFQPRYDAYLKIMENAK